MAYILHSLNGLKSEVMKTIKLIMANLFFVLGFSLIPLYVNSQDIKLNQQERKEVRKAQMAANFYIMDSLLNAKSFVLEADFLRNKYGVRVPVMSGLNFIKVDKSNGVLQTGSNDNMGYNGVGGVTAEGRIGIWEIKKYPKKLSYTLRFSLLTQIGHYDVFMTISSDNNASATITGLWPGQLTWEGHLETIYNSRVFKGQNTI
jgi:hypothetical protein